MPAPLSDIVDVTLTSSPGAVAQPGFGIGLFLATHKYNTDRIRTYTKPSGLTDDGFLTTDPAYLAAVEYFSQQPAPKKMKVGRRLATTVYITPVAFNNFDYSLKVNAIAHTYTSDGSATLTEILDGLVAAIGAVTGLTITNDANTKLKIVSTVEYILGALSAHLSIDTITPTSTVAADLDAISNVDADFYGVTMQQRDSSSQQSLASWSGSNKRLAFSPTKEADVLDVAASSDTTTLPAIEKAAAQDRVAVTYGIAADTSFVDVAEMARVLALPPGSYTAAMKDLIGIAVDTLTATQRLNALAKNCNIYEVQGDGLPGLRAGKVASGKFIDQIHGRDWLIATIGINVFTVLRAPKKVPFDDAGIALIKSAILSAMAAGQESGYILKGSVTISMPKAADVTSGDRAARTLTGIVVNYTEAGAVHSVSINLSVAT